MNFKKDKNERIKIENELQEKKLEEGIVAYTIDGKPLTSADYSKHIESISNAVTDGAETYTSAQVRASILERR